MTTDTSRRRGLMVPSAADILRRRHTVLIVLRLLSLFWMAWGFLLIFSWIIEGIGDNDLFELAYYAGRISGSLLFFVAAAIFRFRDRWLARWIVPVLNPECPNCGYRLVQMTLGRCPECGLHLIDHAPDDDAEPPDEPTPR